MPREKTLPFHSFTFTLIADKRPRTALRLTAQGGGLYELHVEKGPASNPLSQFTRSIPVEVAERLRDAMQDLGVFGWDESYGDSAAPGTRRWSLSIVFEEGVFSLASRGGSDAPTGFDGLLEELYRLDFPRPAQPRQNAGIRSAGGAINAMGLGRLGSLGGMSAGDLGAYAATGESGMDFSQMADSLKGGLGGLDAREMQDLLAQAQSNPEALRQRMKDEFRHLSPEEQSQMLDALAATGIATREWWERFLRG